jgi:hypothetical protein
MNKLFGEAYKDYFPISLGFTCHVKVLIEQICETQNLSYPRLPFDWIGTPMSSVYEMTMSNFDTMVDSEKLVVRKRFSDKTVEYLTHVDYNFVFVHDFKNIHSIPKETFDKVSSDYIRRVARWNTVLSSGRKMLFLRLEQDGENRIVYPGCERADDEYTYLQKFADHMKTRKLKFIIIFFSQKMEKGFDSEHNIITIHYNKARPDIVVSGDHLGLILSSHRPFIESCCSL